MHILLLTIGSHGDIHPFIGLGLALQARGHQVRFVTNDYFQPLVERAGLRDFVALGSADEYRQMAKNPELWDKTKGIKKIFEFVGRGLSQVYDVAADHHRQNPEDGVVVSSSLCLGARVAQDEMGFPMATVHLSPSLLRSLVSPSKLPGLIMPPWFPLWLRASIWQAIDKFAIDPLICPVLNQFRASKWLPPVNRPLFRWWHSPDRVLGLWPEWFAPVQPDWPSQTRLCGFPLYDEKELEPLSPALEQFLAAGDKPIAFTPGSAMWAGERFFQTSVAACQRLNRRGILLSRHSEHIPTPLPPGIIHVPFVPFSTLLPHVAALVHHGGIGTTSQALAAGIPQLIMAMSHDQPDNGHRIEQLGVGLMTRPAKYTPAGATESLRKLFALPKLSENCKAAAAKFDQTHSFDVTCQAIEALIDNRYIPRRQ